MIFITNFFFDLLGEFIEYSWPIVIRIAFDKFISSNLCMYFSIPVYKLWMKLWKFVLKMLTKALQNENPDLIRRKAQRHVIRMGNAYSGYEPMLIPGIYNRLTIGFTTCFYLTNHCPLWKPILHRLCIVKFLLNF